MIIEKPVDREVAWMIEMRARFEAEVQRILRVEREAIERRREWLDDRLRRPTD